MSKILVHYDGIPHVIEHEYTAAPGDDNCPRCGSDDWEYRGEMEGYYIFRCRQCQYYEKVQG